MKLCEKCGQLVAEDIMTCPSCGSEVREGRKYIDDYRILEVLHEGYSSILCRAIQDGGKSPVMIRIFTPQSGVDKTIADRLKKELEELKKLPEDYFVRHLEIRKSQDGLWYRVSEWIDAQSWGTLLASGILEDYRVLFGLFRRIASILEGLHQIGHIIPHLILDDIIVFKGEQDKLEVKIDYKLSRFLDPKMDRPGPMLKKLLSCHPDIINKRPLNVRSDIWSLGKIFVELLSADPESRDFQAKIDSLQVPHEIEVLLKIMLAEDVDLRPRSMAEVAETLAHVEDSEEVLRRPREPVPSPVHEIRGIKKRISLLAIVVALLVFLGGLAWVYFAYKERDSEAILEDYANRYAGSVAFVVVDYWLKDGDAITYRNRTEGTAFLVDNDGYLLTNRHVACPWLEDPKLYAIITRLRGLQRSLSLEYRGFLWFEGGKAFKRLPGLSGSTDLDDVYFTESAFRTDGIPRLKIAGVAKPPVKTWQLVKSPLKNDFAVLKIDRVPDGLKPIPLAHRLKATKIPRLSPVIALGFPLGSETQEATVNVSVTRGHVRRTFEDLIQVDTSIYRGNSGGPIIDIHGKAIGIASSVAMDWAAAPVPVATLLSDMGMILPMTKAAVFLQELKSGAIKWNGLLDLSVEKKLKQITELAGQGQWAEAGALADKELKLSFDPTLVMAAGMMHFISEDYQGAKDLFVQALSMDAEDQLARLMLFLIDWLSAQSNESPYRNGLLALDWRSPSEFFGYLVRILEGHVGEESALKGGYSKAEKSWITYAVGLNLAKRGDLMGSESLLKRSVLEVDSGEWVFFLAFSKLKHVQRERMSALKNAAERTRYQARIETFAQTVEKALSAKAKHRAELEPLIAKFKNGAMSPRDKQVVLEKMLENDKTNGEILLWLAYYSAIDESWNPALEYAQTYLKIQGRESAGRLNLGLLQAEIFHKIGNEEKAKTALEEYKQRTKDPWYRAICECLMNERTEQSLVEKAGESPEYAITAHTALGFWAEGSGDKKMAIRHYKEALGSYMDERVEYEFAIERIKKLRQISE